MKKSISKKAFTLIELMIVVVILGILMATVLPKITGGQEKSRDVARKADVLDIAKAVEIYKNEKNDNTTPANADADNCLSGSTAIAPGSALVPNYIKKIPTDQKSNNTMNLAGDTTPTLVCDGQYFYTPLVYKGRANKGYIVCATVEDPKQANFLNVAAAKPLSGLSGSTTGVVLVDAGTYDKATHQTELSQRRLFFCAQLSDAN